MVLRRADGRSERIGRRVVIALLLGALTSLAVAATLAVRQSNHLGNFERWGERLVGPGGVHVTDPADGHAPPNTMYFEVRGRDEAGVTFVYSRLRAFMNYTPAAPPPVNPAPETAIGHRWEWSRVTPWLTGDREWPMDNATQQVIHVKAAGWPLRCVWCEIYGKNAPDPTGRYTHVYVAKGGMTFNNGPRPGWADWPPDYPIVIPLRPIVPELAVNSALFGVPWAILLLRMPVSRGLRRWRGECERCGYDRRGLTPGAPCPECGGAVLV